MDSTTQEPERGSRARSGASRLVASLRAKSRLLLVGWTEETVPADRTAMAASGALADDLVARPLAAAPEFAGREAAARRRPARRTMGPRLRRALTAVAAAAVLIATNIAGPTQMGSPARAAEAVPASVSSALAILQSSQGQQAARPSAPAAPSRSTAPLRALTAAPGTPSTTSSAVILSAGFDDAGTLQKPLSVTQAAVPSAPAIILYHAVRGDTVSSIAHRFGISNMTIWWANRLVDLSTIHKGQLIRILPVSGVLHTVRDGDTLDSIAQAYRADARVIAAYNDLQGGVVILGQRLIIPDGRGAHYEPIPGVSRLTPLPRLRPGQADRAAEAGPGLAASVVPTGTTGDLGVKTASGVGWPSDPGTTAWSASWWLEYYQLGLNVTTGSPGPPPPTTAPPPPNNNPPWYPGEHHPEDRSSWLAGPSPVRRTVTCCIPTIRA